MISLMFSGMWDVAQATDPKYGGTLTFGAEYEFRGFDALTKNALTICDAIVNSTIHERLFDVNTEGNLIPALGLSATSSESGKVWMIKLRKGVSFHDGTPFNADAVVHHWSRLLNPENKFRGRSQVAPIQSVEKVDDFTVRFNLTHAWLPFSKILTDTRTLTSYVLSPKAVDEGTQIRAPVGTGPFMFKEWKSGDRLVVVKNPNYWQKGKPYLDEIVFKPAPDHQTRFASLQSGEVDVIFMDRGHILKQADADDSLVHYQGEGNGAETIILNTTKSPLDDVRVRRAIAHTWNQERYVSMSYKDSIPTAHHPFGNGLPCGDAGYRKHDLEKAKQLIAEYGKPVEIECLHTNSKRGREFGVILQQFGKEAGINVKPAGMAVAGMVKNVFSKNYHMSSWRIAPMTDHGPYLFRSFHSKSRANVTGYNNPKMDELLVAQRMETDPEKREKLLCDIAELINEDVPIIYRGGRRIHILAKQKVRGIPEIQNGVIHISDAWIVK